MARVFDHTSAVCLSAKVNHEIPRTKSSAVPEGNVPFPHVDYGSGEPTMMAVVYRLLKQGFNKLNKHLDKLTVKIRATNQHLSGLQLQAQQPRLAAEADVKPGTKTRERTEGVAVDDENYGDISSA